MLTTLTELAAEVEGAELHGDATRKIVNVAYDSRLVQPGTLYFCVPGGHVDGHDFAPQAIGSGAAALVTERMLDVDVPQLVVPSVRAAMGPFASTFFGHPAESMELIGITGTNGKTTTAFMLEQVFRARAITPGIIGTVEYHVGDVVEPASRTTPEAIDLQRLLARMRDAGVAAAAMEVSSEGLAFQRVEGTRFACSIFTNLSQDHLNTHGSMDAYFDAKALLFRPEMSARAVVNIDDPHGEPLRESLDIPVTTFALSREADVRAVEIEMDAAGSTVVADVAGALVELRVALPARYNIENALGVLAVAHALRWSLDAAIRGIGATAAVPGRLERVDAGQGFTVLVDYAHTPDSLEGVLRAAREFTPDGARVTVVFGCGGDRDRGKRPLMGRAAASLADRAIITSDNPRTEDPRAIIAEIEEGARATGRTYDVEPDRRAAIDNAIRNAHTGDVIVIAGKGHEVGQQFADRTVPFDDRAVAREILETL